MKKKVDVKGPLQPDHRAIGRSGGCLVHSLIPTIYFARHISFRLLDRYRTSIIYRRLDQSGGLSFSFPQSSIFRPEKESQ